MCGHCDTLRLAIQKGQKLAEGSSDMLVAKNLHAFIEDLRTQLAALESQPDHGDEA